MPDHEEARRRATFPRRTARRAAANTVLACATLALGCATTPARPVAPAPEPSTVLRVLFVGNSLTESNDLPGMVAALSRAAPADPAPIATGRVTRPNFSLADHLADGAAARAIAGGGWDVVALQQGPSALPESRIELLDSARRFAALIHAAGARPALYVVWPSGARSFDLDAVIESYTLAAREVDGVLLPAGLAWKIAWRRDSAFPLYGSDGFHPSTLGTYTAALAVHAALTGRSPLDRPGTLEVAGARVEVPAAQAEVARRAADEAVRAAAAARPARPADR
jgi:hypothetical protein